MPIPGLTLRSSAFSRYCFALLLALFFATTSGVNAKFSIMMRVP